MRRTLLSVAVIATTLFAGNSFARNVKLIVGATPKPHAEILQLVKPILAKQGVNLVIKEFTDYVTPNMALESGDLDANYFQHLPYLESFTASHKIKDLVSIAKIHVEPLALYSKKYKSLKSIKNGSVIAVPNDPSNEARALILLVNAGLIKLADVKNLKSTIDDIKSNPHHFKFKEVEAPQLPRILQDVGGAVINGNYAIQAGLNPMKNGLIVEDAKSPYANIVVVKKANAKKSAILKLVKVLQSKTVKNYIQKQYKGAIVATF